MDRITLPRRTPAVWVANLARMLEKETLNVHQRRCLHRTVARLVEENDRLRQCVATVHRQLDRLVSRKRPLSKSDEAAAKRARRE